MLRHDASTGLIITLGFTSAHTLFSANCLRVVKVTCTVKKVVKVEAAPSSRDSPLVLVKLIAGCRPYVGLI